MPRNTSSTFRQAAYSQETGEAVAVLLKIEHSDFSTIRVTNMPGDITRTEGGSSVTYAFYPFKFELPPSKDQRVPSARLILDNVDQQIISAIRGVDAPPTIETNVVLASSPDTVEVGPINFDIRNISYDKQTIRTDLQFEPVLQMPFPADKITPQHFNELPGRD